MLEKCKTTALCNQKGGVGKTTTCINLGVGLAMQGKKVLLIDADPQASMTLSLGNKRPDDLPVTISDVMQNIIEEKEMPEDYGILQHMEGVSLLPSNIALSGIELNLVNAMSRENILRTYINSVKKNYDYILIDCPPTLGMLNINALSAADSVIIPSQPHFLSTKGLELLLKSVAKVRRQINPNIKIDGILLTMVDKRSNFTKDIISLLKNQYGERINVFKTEIPISVRAIETGAEGKSIYAHDPHGKVANAYSEFTKEVIENGRQNKYRTDFSR